MTPNVELVSSEEWQSLRAIPNFSDYWTFTNKYDQDPNMVYAGFLYGIIERCYRIGLNENQIKHVLRTWHEENHLGRFYDENFESLKRTAEISVCYTDILVEMPGSPFEVGHYTLKNSVSREDYEQAKAKEKKPIGELKAVWVGADWLSSADEEFQSIFAA